MPGSGNYKAITTLAANGATVCISCIACCLLCEEGGIPLRVEANFWAASQSCAQSVASQKLGQAVAWDHVGMVAADATGA